MFLVYLNYVCMCSVHIIHPKKNHPTLNYDTFSVDLVSKYPNHPIFKVSRYAQMKQSPQLYREYNNTLSSEIRQPNVYQLQVYVPHISFSFLLI